MTTRKKTFVIVSISLLVIIVSGFSFVIITGACGPSRGFGPMSGHGFHKRGMPPFMQKEIGSFMLWRMDKGVKTLDLSQAQEKEYNTFRSKLEKTIDDGIKTKMEFRQHAISEFGKENPDLAVITGKIQTDIELMSDTVSENLTLFNNFYNSLNDKQKRTITETIKERIESHKNYNSSYESQSE